MKKIVFILFFGLFLIGDGLGQSEKSNYLVTYSGKIVYADSLTYKSPYFYCDTSIIHEDEVSYFMNDLGRFENTKQTNQEHKTVFKRLKSPVSKNDSTNFIVLYSGEVIKCKTILYEFPNIITDSVKYLAEDVKFYQLAYDRYINKINYSLFSNYSNFIKAKSTGKINFYEHTTKFSHMKGGGGYNNSNSYTETTTRYYYNKGFGDLKYVKIRSLLRDMSDNPECTKRLKEFKFRLLFLFKPDDAMKEIFNLYNNSL
jgi:hypothetical protein